MIGGDEYTGAALDAPEDIRDLLVQLEKRLATASATLAELSTLIAEDCVEFGGSGRRYDKREILAAISHGSRPELRLSEFHARMLAPNIALLTYVAVDGAPHGPVRSRRGSIWRCDRGRWQLVFHQGTPMRGEE